MKHLQYSSRSLSYKHSWLHLIYYCGWMITHSQKWCHVVEIFEIHRLALLYSSSLHVASINHEYCTLSLALPDEQL